MSLTFPDFRVRLQKWLVYDVRITFPRNQSSGDVNVNETVDIPTRRSAFVPLITPTCVLRASESTGGLSTCTGSRHRALAVRSKSDGTSR